MTSHSSISRPHLSRLSTFSAYHSPSVLSSWRANQVRVAPHSPPLPSLSRSPCFGGLPGFSSNPADAIRLRSFVVFKKGRRVDMIEPSYLPVDYHTIYFSFMIFSVPPMRLARCAFLIGGQWAPFFVVFWFTRVGLLR